MRLAAVGFGHEANSFAPARATLNAWRAEGILEGAEIRARHRTAESIPSGFFAYEAEQPGVEVVPLVYAWITPTGASTAEAFEHLTGRMIGALRAGGPWDGVLLPQHGAAVADGFPDADGEFVRRVRAAVGPQVPIGMTLDLHANVSDLMVAHADVITVYQTNPHVDAAAQGLACARLIGRTARGEISPAIALAAPPLAINIIAQGTAEEPMAGLLALARQAERRRGVLSVSVVEGFPYADVPEMGVSVVAVTDNQPDLAAEIAADVAGAAWASRGDMVGDALGIDDALRQAAAEPGGPVVLLDMGDNVGGGSPGDSTHLLHAARRLGITGVAVSLYDEVAVAACHAAGVGGRVGVAVGGRTDDRHGTPLPVTGEVIALSDGRFEDSTPTHGGARFFDLGPTAGIHTDDGLLLAVHARPAATHSQVQFRIAGIEPREVRIIAAKGVHSPRAGFEPIASRLIWVNTPGATSADLATLGYRLRRKPMFPFEPDTAWAPR
ncbi:M81 family metallopeptidase [Jiangella gansuensis]|uniref:M81 family metallopeptidase n=1 Tax=Jiangella gansuensis TaxID=281473 RepID=UPI0004B86C26|nr:M81 family metallopeptidase [Jiangella gansuensis]